MWHLRRRTVRRNDGHVCAAGHYSDVGSWKLAQRIWIRRHNLLPMLNMADVVEVTEEGLEADGVKLLIHFNAIVAAYSFQRELWCWTKLFFFYWIKLLAPRDP